MCILGLDRMDRADKGLGRGTGNTMHGRQTEQVSFMPRELHHACLSLGRALQAATGDWSRHGW